MGIDKSARRRAHRTVAVAAIITMGLGLFLVGLPTTGGASPAAPVGNAKITICHATDSNTNPYVQIRVDTNSTKFAGHEGHDGPVWDPTLKAQHIKWGDIIPPTSDDGTVTVTPKNYTTEGKAILDAGCTVTPPTTTTTTEPETTTTTAPQTTTTAPSGVQGSTTTTAPQSTTTTAPRGVQGPGIPGGPPATTGDTSPGGVQGSSVLARTGHTVALTTAGIALMAAGVLLLFGSRKRRAAPPSA